jgi:chalcone isomerase-like protein
MKAILAATLSLALVLPAAAGTLAGVSMPDQGDAAGTKVVLNGMALRSKLMFKVYVAGLYLPSKETSGDKVLASDGTRQMVMQWVRSVGKDPICEGWYEGLEANTPNAPAELKKDFDTLCSWMGEVKNGDRFVFTYVPGTGTSVEVAGQSKGTIAGKPFADALFACWIGPKPGPGEDFKQALLGG